MFEVCGRVYLAVFLYEDTRKYVLKETYCTSVQHINRCKKMINNNQKQIQTKLTKGLLDMIILQYLDKESMHGYQLITKIRKGFGVYVGPSTMYPLLSAMEKKGYVTSTWNMETDRPRKVYMLTNAGKSVLSYTENSLNVICKKMSADFHVKAEPLSSALNFQKSDERSIIC
jgi:PadR family transcriptional regulator PadR